MNRTLDARGLRCPWPALRAAAGMRDSADLTILADDPAAPDEIEALARARGWVFRLEKPGVLRLTLLQANDSLSGVTVR
jgi:TusA-related sulfurtransferase